MTQELDVAWCLCFRESELNAFVYKFTNVNLVNEETGKKHL